MSYVPVSLSLKARQQQLGQGYRCACGRCEEERRLEPQEALVCRCGRQVDCETPSCACGKKFKPEESKRHLEEAVLGPGSSWISIDFNRFSVIFWSKSPTFEVVLPLIRLRKPHFWARRWQARKANDFMKTGSRGNELQKALALETRPMMRRVRPKEWQTTRISPKGREKTWRKSL